MQFSLFFIALTGGFTVVLAREDDRNLANVIIVRREVDTNHRNALPMFEGKGSHYIIPEPIKPPGDKKGHPEKVYSPAPVTMPQRLPSAPKGKDYPEHYPVSSEGKTSFPLPVRDYAPPAFAPPSKGKGRLDYHPISAESNLKHPPKDKHYARPSYPSPPEPAHFYPESLPVYPPKNKEHPGNGHYPEYPQNGHYPEYPGNGHYPEHEHYPPNDHYPPMIPIVQNGKQYNGHAAVPIPEEQHPSYVENINVNMLLELPKVGETEYGVEQHHGVSQLYDSVYQTR